MQNFMFFVSLAAFFAFGGLLLVYLAWIYIKIEFPTAPAPSISPEEIRAAKAHAAQQEKSPELAGAVTAPPLDESQVENETQESHQVRDQVRDRYRRHLWRKRQARRAKLAAQLEQARVEAFPAWLVTFATDQLKLDRTSANLAALRDWTKHILEFGQVELGHTLPVKSVYYGLRDCDQAPFENVASFHFFHRLSKTLTEAGLLIPQVGNAGRRIAPDAIALLYPALRVALQAASRKCHVKRTSGRVAKLKTPEALPAP